MSAPVETEQPTLPLPIPGTEDLPPRHSDFKESGLWLFPGGPVAGIAVGVAVREFAATTPDAQLTVTVALLALLLVATFGAFVVPKTVGRGTDGRS